MTSLPLEVPKRFRDIPDAVMAYDICLGLEKFLLLAVVNKGDDVGSKLIYVRILGYLVHHFPTDQGLGNIVEEIISSVDDSALQVDVGKIYYDHYIGACTFLFPKFQVNTQSAIYLVLTRSPVRVNKGRIPTPSNNECPVLFDTIAKMATHSLVDVLQSHTDAKMNVGHFFLSMNSPS